MGPKSTASAASPGSASRRRKPAAKKGTAQRDSDKPTPASPSPSCACSVMNFLLLTITNLSLNTVLFSLAAPLLREDLAWESKQVNSWREIGVLLAWRVLELAIPYALGYDSRDITSLFGISHAPTYTPLIYFYGVRPTTAIIVSVITVLSAAIPFYIFRSLSPVHRGEPVPNRHVIGDIPTILYTATVAALVYILALYISFATWLPAFLVTHFDGIPDISLMHAGAKSFIPMFIQLFPVGIMVRDFLFVGSASQSQPDEQEGELSPAELEERHGELLITSLYRKYWLSRPKKTRVLVSRTITLAVMILVNTVVQLVGTLSGAEAEGVLGWAGIWAVSTVVIGVIFGWIEAVDCI